MGYVCQKRGCGAAASHMLKLAAGTVLDADDAPPRVSAMIGVFVCEPHLDEEEASRWFECSGEVLRAMLSVGLGANSAPLDVDRAVILGVPLGSDEFRAWQLETLKPRAN